MYGLTWPAYSEKKITGLVSIVRRVLALWSSTKVLVFYSDGGCALRYVLLSRTLSVKRVDAFRSCYSHSLMTPNKQPGDLF